MKRLLLLANIVLTVLALWLGLAVLGYYRRPLPPYPNRLPDQGKPGERPAAGGVAGINLPAPAPGLAAQIVRGDLFVAERQPPRPEATPAKGKGGAAAEPAGPSFELIAIMRVGPRAAISLSWLAPAPAPAGKPGPRPANQPLVTIERVLVEGDKVGETGFVVSAIGAAQATLKRGEEVLELKLDPNDEASRQRYATAQKSAANKAAATRPPPGPGKGGLIPVPPVPGAKPLGGVTPPSGAAARPPTTIPPNELPTPLQAEDVIVTEDGEVVPIPPPPPPPPAPTPSSPPAP